MAEQLKETEIIDEQEDEMLQRFKSEIALDADHLDDLRQEAIEDMRFINVPGGMWEDFLDNRFGERVKLEFDIITNFVNRFVGQWNQNRVGVEFKPDDSKTSDEDAELLNGIYRADFRQNSGKLSVDNAVDEVATCGYGCFKLATRFEDEFDAENELQRIEWRPINNAHSTVIWDASAQRIDKRDAMHVTELVPFTRSAFKKTYPDLNPVSAYTPDQNNFFYNTGDELVYVANRYEVIRRKEKVYIYNDFALNRVIYYTQDEHKKIKDELAENEAYEFVRERKVISQHVEKSVFTGDTYIEEPRRIVGKWLPIIPMYGYRSYVDGREWYRGLVRKLKDAARLFNMQVSQLAENAASAGQEVPIFDPDQLKDKTGEIKAGWADKNNKPFLYARALRDQDGNIVHHGPLGYSKPGTLDQSTSQLMQIVPLFVQDSTGGAPQDTLDPNASGKAINALTKRSDLNTQVIFDNIANAIEWSGCVYQDMAQEVYTQARMLRIIGKDGTESETQLFKTVLDEETGMLIEANTLSGKKFRAYADIGPQYETQREQTVEDLKGMLAALADTQAGAQYQDVLISTMLSNISGVGMEAVRKVNRNQMIMKGFIDPETDEEKAMLAQAQQGQPDPTQDLLRAEADRAAAEARSLDASALQKTADAGKKQAETAEIIAETNKLNQEAQIQPVKTLMEIREQTLKQASSGF